MAEIAVTAGVSRGTPAYFFQSKEGLYRAALGRAFAETAELARSTDFNASFEEAITTGVRRYLDFLSARPGFVRLVIRDCLDGGRFLQGLPEHLAALAEGMNAIGAGSGTIRSGVDARHLLLSAISMCWFPMVARPLTADLGFDPGSTTFRDERKQQVAELLVHGALANQ